jgi:hypothetical protein
LIPSRSVRAAWSALCLCVLLSGVSGCLFRPPSEHDDPPDLRVPVPESVERTIAVYAFVWEQRRLDLYEELLHDGFEYFPQEADADDFPWLTGTSWGRSEELGMAAHMFNPEFASEVTGETVDAIHMGLSISDERITPDGVEVTVDADIQVFWSASASAVSHVRFVFLIVGNPEEPGLFQIRRQQELPEFN